MDRLSAVGALVVGGLGSGVDLRSDSELVRAPPKAKSVCMTEKLAALASEKL